MALLMTLLHGALSISAPFPTLKPHPAARTPYNYFNYTIKLNSGREHPRGLAQENLYAVSLHDADSRNHGILPKKPPTPIR